MCVCVRAHVCVSLYVHVHVCGHVMCILGRAGMKDLLPSPSLQASGLLIVLPVYLQKAGALWLSVIIVCAKNWQVINRNLFFN